MQTHLVQIGSSRGLRLPKLLIEKYELSMGVEIKECEEGLMIKKRQKPREGWAEKFEKIATHEQEADMLLMENDFDQREWEW